MGDVTAPKRSPTVLRGTLGQRYSPPNVPQQGCAAPSGNACPFFVARESALIPSRISSETHLQHPWETSQAYIVPQQGHATLSGDITAPKRSTTVLRDTLGRHYKPISFHNRAVRHPRATFQPLNVPHQFCAAPSGNTLPLFRRRNVRIDPVMNKPGDTFGTLGTHFKPTSFHNSAVRHLRATLLCPGTSC